MKLRSVRQAKLKGKRVLFRVDYNTPLTIFKGKRQVADDTRIKITLPTLQYLIQKKSKIIIVSHLGRPGGKRVKELDLEPVAKKLENLIGQKVTKLNDISHPSTKQAIDSIKPGDIAILDNIRFLPGETKNDSRVARSISQLADLIVNDGFAVSHRNHASVSGVAKFLPMYAGFNLMLEVKMLTKLMSRPKRPLIVIIGGAKVSDKVNAIHNLANVADSIIVGGGVANNFLKAGGVDILSSYLQDTAADKKTRSINFVKIAKRLMASLRSQKMLLNGYIPIPKIVTPIDVVAADKKKNPRVLKTLNVTNKNQNGKVSKKLMFLDIGPSTIKLYQDIIGHAKTIFWNGPMGVFEEPKFARGTKEIARAVARARAITIIGGGDTISAIKQFKLTKKYDYVSSAGGASLEFLTGNKLPGLEPMRVKN